jgi:hypothetical protein
MAIILNGHVMLLSILLSMLCDVVQHGPEVSAGVHLCITVPEETGKAVFISLGHERQQQLQSNIRNVSTARLLSAEFRNPETLSRIRVKI